MSKFSEGWVSFWKGAAKVGGWVLGVLIIAALLATGVWFLLLKKGGNDGKNGKGTVTNPVAGRDNAAAKSLASALRRLLGSSAD